MNQRTDAAEVFGFLRKLHLVGNTAPVDVLGLDRAFRAAKGKP